MQFLVVASALAGTATAALTGSVTAQHSQAEMALRRVMERQFELCEPVTAPYTCERSCGSGYTECVSFPTCYNPGNGESCCSNGKYCPQGYYCTDAGCCPNEYSLAECGAGEVLPTLDPYTSQEPTPTPTFTPEPEPTTYTNTYTYTSEESTTTTFSYTPIPDPTTSSTTSSSTTTSSTTFDLPSVTPVPLPSPSGPPTGDAAKAIVAPLVGGLAMLLAL